MSLPVKKRFKIVFTAFFMILSAAVAMIALAVRLPGILKDKRENLEIMAAATMFPNGNVPYNVWNWNENSNLGKDNNFMRESVNNEQIMPDRANENVTEPAYTDEQTYKIIESKFGAGGVKFESFYVNNRTGFNLDIGSELQKRPDIHINKNGDPQVLIMHTHTSEAYMDKDQGFFYESYYPRSADASRNVTGVGEVVGQKLKEAGIGVIHDVTLHDDPSYSGSYGRAAETITRNLASYPSLQVVLDLHRDALGSKEKGKIKPTFTFNKKKAAQIMILAGYDKDGSNGFASWEYNLRFALRLQRAAETMFPGMTRPMYFNNVRYNMNLSHGSVLVEIGTDMNTMDEALYTGSLFGDVLVNVLNELQD